MTAHDGSDDELAARLIRAGIRETPPPATLQKTLLGLGLGASAVGTASTAGALGLAKATASITVGAVAKWVGVGATAGLVLAAASDGVYRATRTVSAPTAGFPSVRPPETAPAPVHAPRAAPTEPAPARTAPALAPPAAPKRSVSSAPVKIEPESPLAAEIAWVDGAREAYQQGDAGATLARLEGYERMFPKQRLLPEVLYLRMQSLSQRGETERAKKLAGRLVRDFPNNPHASRARALLQGSTER
jgi:hypothetical protein